MSRKIRKSERRFTISTQLNEHSYVGTIPMDLADVAAYVLDALAGSKFEPGFTLTVRRSK